MTASITASLSCCTHYRGYQYITNVSLDSRYSFHPWDRNTGINHSNPLRIWCHTQLWPTSSIPSSIQSITPSLHLVVTQTKEPYERGMYPTISFPSSWDPAQPSTPSSSHRLWYRLFRVWYDHPLKVGHHSLCSFLNRRAIPHSTGKAMGNKIRIAVRYFIGLFFTILMKRIIQWSELWFSLCFGGWER